MVTAMDARSARLALGFSSVGHSFAHLVTLLYPTAVLALVGQFDMSYGELLELSTLGFVLFGVAALPAGWLGDRWSAEGMMVLFPAYLYHATVPFNSEQRRFSIAFDVLPEGGRPKRG